MTLGTHIVVGTTLATAYASGPASAFAVGLVTHYLLDAIPHWDYPISISKVDPEVSKSTKMIVIAWDVIKVVIDVAIGVAILSFVLSPDRFLNDPRLIAGVIGSAFPDFLQFGLLVYKNKILDLLQKFHHMFHSAANLNDKPVRGIVFQLAMVSFFVFALIG